jgi:DNA-binding PadR family transcriptional regulator
MAATDERDVVLREFFLGFVRLHVLYHAGHAPVCGVGLMAEMAHHGYRLTPGTLYPLLHRLERAGFLTHQDRNVGGRRRRYYSRTERGAAVLAEAARRLPELVGEVLGGARAGSVGEHPATGAGARIP